MRRWTRFLGAHRRLLTVGSVLGVMLGATGVALAGMSTGSTSCVSGAYGGHNYCGNAIMYTGEPGSPSDWAYAQIYTAGGDDVPGGWIGADAIKYRNGTACEQTGYQYNGSSTNAQGALADTYACGSGTYNAGGYVDYWNGSGYDAFGVALTPSLNG